ncbi:Dihydrofolate synthase @ Folylpolyglutamate synthase [hydrothermal vent metagenome]|uniref:Dihydrofolate synthase @ Folylpolyglutamate synthase n=1 Tax=hydrothermal vent metagenome TaxID=652676 RepID=A0A3B1EA03_9ZZZZ
MTKNKTSLDLYSFLDNKTLFFNKINYDVIYLSWELLKAHISLPFVIHIIGTNGKGSTGRYLSHILYKNGYKTLHYSSPHILCFNERIWINGNNGTNKELEIAHQSIQKILPHEIVDKLTYFEYTTLLAIWLSSDLDYLILEAGLGGEFDATNIVINNLTLITTIGFDHTEFLGDTIFQIASTKMRSCDNAFILGKQIFDSDVLDAKEKVLKLKKEIKFNNHITLPKKASNLPEYLKDNLKLTMNTLKYLNIDIQDFTLPVVFGRCYKLSLHVTIDVGHNSLAATAIVKEFIGKKIILIYNSYADKNYKEILRILKPIIKELQIIKIKDERIVKESDLIKVCNTLDIIISKYDRINNKEEYLVFGSFKVVEKFLKSWDNY